MSFFGAITGNYAYDSSGFITYTPGEYLYVYMLFIGMLMVLFIKNVRRTARLNQEKRNQVKTVSLGLTLTAVHAALFIILLPLLFGEQNILYVIGYLAPVYFVGATSYSLLKQQLFDFRLAFARAATYAFTTVAIVTIYVLVAFVITELIIGEGSVDRLQLIGNIVLTVLLVINYPSLKRFFDMITNKIFYRDLYDPQQVLEEINEITSGTVDLKTILEQTSRVIEGTFKSQGSGVHIVSRNKDIGTITFGNMLADNSLEAIKKSLVDEEEVIYLLDLEENKDRRALEKNDIEVVLKLHTSETENMGYFFIGPKKSGLAYTKQDLQMLSTAGKTISVSAENALRFEEIAKFNETLQEEVTEATRKLRHTNEKLKALDETKDEFISMASHQLRTPLTSVKGYVSMVLEGDAGELNEQQKKLLNQAFISSQRMVYLIADLLNVSRLRTGKFVIETAPTYLPDVVEGELGQLYETAAAKGLKLSFDKPADFPTLNLDETKIRQVIMNFADNAIYYTPAGGEISVQLTSSPKAIEFKVVDNGLGVPKKEQHHLFGKFYRADNAKKARPDGTGLGLFMAKKVVIAQGGAIIFSSKEGKGSTFGFTFPRHGMESKTEEHTS
jgi:signal transduction histidine kinase